MDSLGFAGINPDFQSRLGSLANLLSSQYGLDIGVGSGYRSPQEQARLYAQGRTAPGPIVTNAPPGSSYHNYGAATDIKPLNMSEEDAGRIIGQAIQQNPSLGLTWGGSFKNLYDPLHVQLGVPLSALRGNYPTALPFNAQPTAGTQMPEQLTNMPGQGGMFGTMGGGGGFLGLGGINSFEGLHNNRYAILGYLSGALQGGNLGQSIGRGLGGFLGGGQVDIQQQGQRALMSALAPQLGPAMAQAVASNPQYLTALKATMPEFKTVQDALGGQVPVWVNPFNQTVSPVNTGGSTQTAGAPSMNQAGIEAGVAKVAQMAQEGRSKQEMLSEVPIAIRSYVAGMLEGNDVPANLGMRAGPVRAASLMYAHAIEPNFNEGQIALRQSFGRQMMSTSPNSFGSQVRSSGTVVEHMTEALKLLPQVLGGPNSKLNISDGYTEQPDINRGLGFTFARANDSKFNYAAGRYRELAAGAAKEKIRLLTGAEGTKEEREKEADAFDPNKHSISEVKGAWDALYTLMQGRLNNVAQQKSMAWGQEIDPASLLPTKTHREGLAELNKLRQSGWVPPQQGTAPAPPQAASPQSAPANIPPPAIDHLKQNPSLAPYFDQKYGAGQAAKVLGAQ